MQGLFNYHDHRHVRDQILPYLELDDLSLVATASRTGRQSIAQYCEAHPAQHTRQATCYRNWAASNYQTEVATNLQEALVIPSLLHRIQQPEFLSRLSPSYANKVDQWGQHRWRVMAEQPLIWLAYPTAAMWGIWGGDYPAYGHCGLPCCTLEYPGYPRFRSEHLAAAYDDPPVLVHLAKVRICTFSVVQVRYTEFQHLLLRATWSSSCWSAWCQTG